MNEESLTNNNILPWDSFLWISDRRSSMYAYAAVLTAIVMIWFPQLPSYTSPVPCVLEREVRGLATPQSRDGFVQMPLIMVGVIIEALRLCSRSYRSGSTLSLMTPIHTYYLIIPLLIIQDALLTRLPNPPLPRYSNNHSPRTESGGVSKSWEYVSHLILSLILPLTSYLLPDLPLRYAYQD